MVSAHVNTIKIHEIRKSCKYLLLFVISMKWLFSFSDKHCVISLGLAPMLVMVHRVNFW